MYKVRAKALFSEYSEVIEEIDGFEDKGKGFVKDNVRVAKNDLGKVQKGNIYGAFFAWVVDINDIQDVRERIHQCVRAYNEEEREKYQANINACRAFEVEEPFQLRKNQEKREGEYM